MISQYLIVENGVCTNVIMWDGVSEWYPKPGMSVQLQNPRYPLEGIGSASVQNGSAVVTVSGALVTAGVGATRKIHIDGVQYVILSIDSETQLTLTSAYTGDTSAAVSYVILPFGIGDTV